MYLDVAFWGLLNGSIVNFLGVYCSRIGASPFQMGMLTAIPAFMNLVVTMPAMLMLGSKPVIKVVPRAALITRLFYGLLIPLPLLLPQGTQMWVILALVLVQNISGTVAAMIGNAFLAENVPEEYRGQVIGTRSALVAITTMLTSIAVGQVLNALSLEIGYAVVFGIGFIGSMLSAFQLFLIKPVQPSAAAAAPAANTSTIRLSILRGPFRKVLLMMFIFHLAIFIPQPIFPLYQVQELKLTDQIISLAASLFSLVLFLVSSQAGSISRRFGYRQMTGIGMLIAGVSTALFTFSFSPWIYFATQLVGGLGWAMFNNGLINYLLENIPPDDRPAHLAWFNIVANAAVLLCGLLSQQVVGGLGLFGGMLLAVALRFFSGFAILKWG
jgi:MFS family permease